jgi:hypothetical protein
VAFRFTSLDTPGDGGRTAIRTSTVVRQAPATKKEDAAKIEVRCERLRDLENDLRVAFLALELVHRGAKTKLTADARLATRGKEVHVPAGTNLIVKLTAPITVRVRR